MPDPERSPEAGEFSISCPLRPGLPQDNAHLGHHVQYPRRPTHLTVRGVTERCETLPIGGGRHF